MSNPDCPLSELHGELNVDACAREAFFAAFRAFTYDSGDDIGFSEALNIAGEPRVRKIALASAMLTTRPAMDGQIVFDVDTYLRRCVTMAVLLESLAQRYKEDSADWAFYAGLMMDAGYLVMIDHMAPDLQQAMYKNTSSAPPDVLQVEKQFMGMDHTEVGVAISEELGFPDIVARGIEYHHSPLDAPEDVRHWASLCHLASWLVDNLGLRIAPGMPEQTLTPQAFDEIKQDPEYQDHVSSSVKFAAGVCDSAVEYLARRAA